MPDIDTARPTSDSRITAGLLEHVRLELDEARRLCDVEAPELSRLFAVATITQGVGRATEAALLQARERGLLPRATDEFTIARRMIEANIEFGDRLLSGALSTLEAEIAKVLHG